MQRNAIDHADAIFETIPGYIITKESCTCYISSMKGRLTFFKQGMKTALQGFNLIGKPVCNK